MTHAPTVAVKRVTVGVSAAYGVACPITITTPVTWYTAIKTPGSCLVAIVI